MTEWWTYRLSDFLLFAPDTYRRLFELAHAQGWPWAQAVAAALGLGVGLCAARAPAQPRAAALGCLLLGAAWAGAALFLVRHYATINWGAPALAAGKWQVAAQWGAMFGFFCYMTYDLTNHATMKIWSTKVTLLDIAWGTLATGFAAGAAAWLVLTLLPRTA